MSTVDQLMPLSEADRLVLTQKRNKQLLLIPALALASLLSLLLMGVIHSCFTMVFFLTLALSTAAKAIHSLASVIKLNRDLSAGQKRVISAPVEDQNIDVSRSRGYRGSEGAASYVFWIKAGGYKLPVTEDRYYQIKKGDLVEADLAPNSGTVFGVRDRSTGDAPLTGNALAQPLFAPPKPRSKLATTLIWGGAGLVVFLIVLGVAGFVAVTMPEREFNRLNPFTPKPPQGAFPATVAGFTRSNEPSYHNATSYGGGKDFQAYYNRSDANSNRQIKYEIDQYSSAEEAKPNWKNHIGGRARVVQQTDNRIVARDADDGTVVLLFGPTLIDISGRIADVIAFENDLPYSAFGISTPPRHSLAEIKEESIPASTLLAEFSQDKAAATKKYQGQTLLFSGTVAAVTHSKEGKPLVALQKPGTTVSTSTILSCSFKPSEDAKVSALKNGQEIRLRGRVNSVFGVLLIEDCELDSDSSPPAAALATNGSTTLSVDRAKRGEAVYQSLLARKKANAPQIFGAFRGAGGLVLCDTSLTASVLVTS